MNQQELNAHFQLISQRLSRHNWNHTFVDTTHIKIDDSGIRAAILWDEYFGIHATCNIFKQYLFP